MMRITFFKIVVASMLFFTGASAFASLSTQSSQRVTFTQTNVFAALTGNSAVGASCSTMLKYLRGYMVTYSVVNGVPAFSADPKSKIFFSEFVPARFQQYYIGTVSFSASDGSLFSLPMMMSSFFASSATNVSFGACQATARLSKIK